jgi:hypothetical protein
VPHRGEWERADGIVVNFGFSPRFFEALAESVGLSEVLSKRPWHHFFAMDQRIEAVCRLLMKKPKTNARGAAYTSNPWRMRWP